MGWPIDEDYYSRLEERGFRKKRQGPCKHDCGYDDIGEREGDTVIGYHCNRCPAVWDIEGNPLTIGAGELSRIGAVIYRAIEHDRKEEA